MKIKPRELLAAIASRTDATDPAMQKAVKNLEKHKGKLATLVKKNLDTIKNDFSIEQKQELANKIRAGMNQKKSYFHKLGQFLQGRGFITKDRYLGDVVSSLNGNILEAKETALKDFTPLERNLYNEFQGQKAIDSLTGPPNIEIWTKETNTLTQPEFEQLLKRAYFPKEDYKLFGGSKFPYFSKLSAEKKQWFWEALAKEEKKAEIAKDIFKDNKLDRAVYEHLDALSINWSDWALEDGW